VIEMLVMWICSKVWPSRVVTSAKRLSPSSNGRSNVLEKASCRVSEKALP